MTLILTLASPHHCIQVSDRRLTLARKHTVEDAIFDDETNKTVVFQTAEAIVCLSYTGLAFIQSTPTDQWIVERMIDHAFKPGKFLMAGRDSSSYVKDVGYCIRRLCASLTETSRGWPTLQRNPLEIVITGYQRAPHMWRPILVTIKCENGAYVAVTHKRLDYLTNFPNRFSWAVAPTGHVTEKQVEEFRRKLGTCSPTDLDAQEAVLTDLMLAVSNTLPVVGSDCISVVTHYPSWDRGIRVRSFLSAVRTIRFSDEAPFEPVIYGPWLVVDGFIVAPHVLNHSGRQWVYSGLKVIHENMGSPMPQTRAYKMSGQQRRVPPR